MNEQVQITIEKDVYDRLKMLMVPPISDVNAAIKALLYHDGRTSPAAVDLMADEQHFTFAQEIKRARMGVYECGGNT